MANYSCCNSPLATKWRIYADDDFLHSTEIGLYPVVVHANSSIFIRSISEVKNRYVFFYLFLF